MWLVRCNIADLRPSALTDFFILRLTFNISPERQHQYSSSGAHRARYLDFETIHEDNLRQQLIRSTADGRKQEKRTLRNPIH